MKAKKIALEIYAKLPTRDLVYARDPARGEYQGFSALHDLCDANEYLIPYVKKMEGDDETIEANEKRYALANEISKELDILIKGKGAS